jgi:PqqD family protein of HPr-rel-A system
MSPLQSLNVTEDGFVFNPSTGESYTLNPCARLVLQRIQKDESYQQLSQFLSDEFGICQNTAERDISDFFQQLKSLGLTGEH